MKLVYKVSGEANLLWECRRVHGKVRLEPYYIAHV